MRRDRSHNTNTTLKGNVSIMPNINIEDAVTADIATLTNAASMVASAVERYTTAKRDTAAAVYTTPLVALATAPSKDAAGAAFSHLVDMLEGEDVEELATLLELAAKLSNKLAVSLATLDTAPAVVAAEHLVGLAASPYQLVSDDLLVAAGVAVTAWKSAYTSYQQASGANVARQTGAPRRGGRGGRGSRGPGKWLEDHGWYFTCECQSCGHVITSASNLGSFSHEMAKHWPSCRGADGGPIRDAAGNRVERIYAGEPAMDAISAAMYAVADGAPMAEAEGMVIRHVDATAAA